MYLQYVKQVRAALRVAMAKVAGKLFFSRGTLPLKAKPSLRILRFLTIREIVIYLLAGSAIELLISNFVLSLLLMHR